MVRAQVATNSSDIIFNIMCHEQWSFAMAICYNIFNLGGTTARLPGIINQINVQVTRGFHIRSISSFPTPVGCPWIVITSIILMLLLGSGEEIVLGSRYRLDISSHLLLGFIIVVSLPE